MNGVNNILGSLWQDLLALLILFSIGLMIYMKLRKKTLREIIQELRGLRE